MDAAGEEHPELVGPVEGQESGRAAPPTARSCCGDRRGRRTRGPRRRTDGPRRPGTGRAGPATARGGTPRCRPPRAVGPGRDGPRRSAPPAAAARAAPPSAPRGGREGRIRGRRRPRAGRPGGRRCAGAARAPRRPGAGPGPGRAGHRSSATAAANSGRSLTRGHRALGDRVPGPEVPGQGRAGRQGVEPARPRPPSRGPTAGPPGPRRPPSGDGQPAERARKPSWPTGTTPARRSVPPTRAAVAAGSSSAVSPADGRSGRT